VVIYKVSMVLASRAEPRVWFEECALYGFMLFDNG